ncbi:MAG: HAMP domain-containing histidine kinase [Nannocystaceae bacterium]|nr:HAMP domain-containing histidine kinase [Nannocystaceae bacterium]
MKADSAQLRAVGTAFLKKRPFIVAPGIAVGVMTSVLAGAPKTQLAALGPSLISMFGFFCIEAWVCRSREVSARWLAWSLHITLVGIALACAMSSGVRSPLLPLTLAPVVVSFAAFGRGRQSALIAATFVVSVALLAALPHGWPWPAVPAPYAGGMTAVNSVVALVLAYVGVAQLSDALATSRESLLRMREDALLNAMDRLRSQETMREKLAHELKNPLASIKGLAQLSVADTKGKPTQKRFEVLLTAAHHMEAVLEEYLSFARPLGEVQRAPVDIDTLVAEAVELVSLPAQRARVELTTQGKAGHVEADRRRITEALLNVLTNALEASAPGATIQIALERTMTDVHVHVRDEGVGLSPSQLERLGTPYFTTKAKGTGLGVVIAMAAIRDHGGELWFSSNDGRGTTASLRIPRHHKERAEHVSHIGRR